MKAKLFLHLVTVGLSILILSSCNNSENNKSEKELELQKKELDLKQKELELKEKQLAMDSINKAKVQTTNTITHEQIKPNTNTPVAEVTQSGQSKATASIICNASLFDAEFNVGVIRFMEKITLKENKENVYSGHFDFAHALIKLSITFTNELSNKYFTLKIVNDNNATLINKDITLTKNSENIEIEFKPSCWDIITIEIKSKNNNSTYIKYKLNPSCGGD